MKYFLVLVFVISLETTSGNSTASDTARAIWDTAKECASPRKCIPFCLLNKFGLADKNGNLQTAKIPFFNYYNNETLLKCMDTQKNKDHCDHFNLVAKCFFQTEMKNYKTNVAACAKTTKFNVNRFHFSDLFEEKYKCFARCVYIKQGVIGEDNNFKKGLIGNLVHHFAKEVPLIDAAVKKCGVKTNADKCNEVFMRMECFGEEMVFNSI